VSLQWFFTEIDGNRIGPFTPRQLERMAFNGKLTPAASLCEKGEDNAVLTRTFKMVTPSPTGPH
jgi:GYF domain 2